MDAEGWVGGVRFRLRAAVVSAIQWDGTNAAEIITMVGRDRFMALDEPPEDPEATAALRHHVHGDWRLVHTGSWIVLRSDGAVRMSDEEFRKVYEEAV